MGIEEQLLDMAKKEGLKTGLEKGRQEEKIQTAREMKTDGQSLELIAKYTKLSIEEIKKL